MTERWLTTIDCAECINRAIGEEKAIGPWYIRDAIRSGALVARVHRKTGMFRKRATFRVLAEDFEAFMKKTTPDLADRVLLEVHAMFPPAA